MTKHRTITNIELAQDAGIFTDAQIQIDAYTDANKKLASLYRNRQTQDTSTRGIVYTKDSNVDNPWNSFETKKQIASLENEIKGMAEGIAELVSALCDEVQAINVARINEGKKMLLNYSNMGAISCREIWFSKKNLKTVAVDENKHKWLICTQRPEGGHDVQSYKAQWECIIHDAKYWIDLAIG